MFRFQDFATRLSDTRNLKPVIRETKSSNRKAIKVMKVTVCELRNDADGLDQDWEALVGHVKSEKSNPVPSACHRI